MKVVFVAGLLIIAAAAIFAVERDAIMAGWTTIYPGDPAMKTALQLCSIEDDPDEVVALVGRHCQLEALSRDLDTRERSGTSELAERIDGLETELALSDVEKDQVGQALRVPADNVLKVSIFDSLSQLEPGMGKHKLLYCRGTRPSQAPSRVRAQTLLRCRSRRQGRSRSPVRCPADSSDAGT
jgi:hypothetical protein